MKIKLSRHRFNKNQISPFLKNSSKIKSDIFTVYFNKDNLQRYAFISPKKMGSSHSRNKVRRQLKEVFVKLGNNIDPDFSIIIIANKKIIHTSFKKIHDVLLLSLKKKKIIDETF